MSNEKEKKGFFSRLVSGLTKTRDNFVKGMDYVFNGFSNIDDEFYEELEEQLIMGDMGAKVTEDVIEELKAAVKKNHVKEPSDCRELLIELLKDKVSIPEDAYEFTKRQSVVIFVGVNGVGKTTTVGKIASKLHQAGKKVLIAGADTFRAAAEDQLFVWSERAGVPMIRGNEGADPGAVVFDACASAKSKGCDTLLIDTAGRLHNKKNLMNELHKIYTIVEKAYPEALVETILVLDGTTGQNALSQAKEFSEVCPVTGLIITKLDGTAKGGVAIAVARELSVPIKYIGVGETVDDLQEFDPKAFVEALFYKAEE